MEIDDQDPVQSTKRFCAYIMQPNVENLEF